MKKIACLASMLLLCAASYGQSQPDYSTVFGTVTDYEMNMTSYEKDSTAHALIIYESMNIDLTYSYNSGYSRVRTYEVKKKILDASMTRLGSVETSYLAGAGKPFDITAAAYNMVDGQVIKTAMGKDMIFNEKYVGDMYLLKFAIPEVKEGTVIEYKYSIRENFVTPPPLTFQQDIPIVSSYARVTYPKFILIRPEFTGFERVSVKRSYDNLPIQYPRGVIIQEMCVLELEAGDVPAFKRENMVWRSDDFLTKVEFDVQAVASGDYGMKYYSMEWKDVDKKLEEDKEFQAIKYNPYKDELKEIIAGSYGERETIRRLHKLVMSKMAWNGQYGTDTSDIRESVRIGSGSSAEMNCLLIGMLRRAGYKADPVLLSRREMGRLPVFRSSLSKINAIAVAVALSDNSVVYLDCSDSGSDINMLPLTLQTDRSRVHKSTPFVSDALSTAGDNKHVTTIMGAIDDAGVLKGRIVTQYGYTPALIRKNEHKAQGSLDEYLEQIEDKYDIAIDNYSLSGMDTCVVVESYDFTMRLNKSGDRMYLDANVLPMFRENPFIQQDVRMMPVELDYMKDTRVIVNISLPENWIVEELPEAHYVLACEGDMVFRYNSGSYGNNLMVNSSFKTTRLVFDPEEYIEIYSAYGLAANIDARRIVLKML